VDEDFVDLVNFEMRKRIAPVVAALAEINANSQLEK
jgi:hypothetical protein